MLKKYLAIVGVASFYLVQAQDVSVIQNSIDVYSNPSSIGTSKYNAMAGAMGALGGDVSVMNTNPAGIGVSITTDMSGTLSVLHNKNTSSFASNSFTYGVRDTNLGQVGGIISFAVQNNSKWKFVNVGISHSSSSVENYIETRGNSGISYDVEHSAGIDRVSLIRHAYDRTGDISKTSIGVGANLDNKWYFGAGVNMHSANIHQKDFAEMGNNNVRDIYFHKQYTPYSEESSGFSMNFGVINKITKNIRVGVALETPTWWRMDRVFEYYDENGVEDGKYPDFREFASPMKTTLSVGYVPNKNFAFNIDYIVGLSKPKYTTDNKGVNQEFKDFYEKNYRNLSEIRVGAEYRYQGLRARAGYAYASNPFNNMAIDAYNNDGRVNYGLKSSIYGGGRYTFGAGLGYDFKAFYVDLAYQHISLKYNTSFLFGDETNGSQYFSNKYLKGIGEPVSAVTKVDNSRNLFTFTAGWKF